MEKANREKILLVGNATDPKALDPHVVTGVIESNIIRSLFEGLVADDPKEDYGRPPGAALSWESNAEYTQWTFHLRPDGKWSDGAALTSHDFVFAYHRILHPDLAGPYADMLHFLKNAEDYNRNRRGKILVNAGLVPGVSWEAVAKVPFGENSKIKIEDLGKSPKWAGLNDEQRGRLAAHRGLDALDREALEWIAKEPGTRYPWPAELPAAVRGALLETMAAKTDEDLFEAAKVGVVALDDYTLQFTMREPVPFLPGITRHYTWFPLPRHVVLRYSKISDRVSPWCEPGKLVGNGPFVLKEWLLNDHIEVVRNPHYRNAANVKLNGIRFIPVENYFTETRGFLAGQLHTTYQLPNALVDELKATHPEFLRQEPYVATDFIRFNINKPGLDNPKVRSALSYAVDRKLLCENLLQGNQPAGTFTPQLGDYKPDPILGFDPEKAKQLLAEAGYPEGRGFPRYSMLISSSGNRGTVEALQAMWRQTLGVMVDLKTMDFASYITAQQNLDYDISLGAWSGDYLDPTTFLLMWTEGNGNNNTGWFSKEYEAKLAEAAQQTDPARRLEMFRVAERMLMDAQPIIPISWRTRNYLQRPEMKGWYPLLLDNHPWAAVSLEAP